MVEHASEARRAARGWGLVIDPCPEAVDLFFRHLGRSLGEHVGDVLEPHGRLTGTEEGEEVHVRHVVVPRQGDVARVTTYTDVRHPLIERETVERSVRLDEPAVSLA